MDMPRKIKWQELAEIKKNYKGLIEVKNFYTQRKIQRASKADKSRFWLVDLVQMYEA